MHKGFGLMRVDLAAAKTFLLVLILLAPPVEMTDSAEPIKRVAHGGGGYQGEVRTNSIEALNHNLRFYELFEVDLVWTSDREMVCLHDWEDSAQKTFGRRYAQTPTLAQFERMISQHPRYKNCTTQTLFAWLEQNPSAKIITDVKDQNIEALIYLKEKYPNLTDRIIPQIYQPEEYRRVKDLGYQSIIWTLYAYQGSSIDVLIAAQKMDLYAVTMPRSKAVEGLALELKRIGIASYVHTINDAAEFSSLRAIGINEIYTDWLIANHPRQPQRPPSKWRSFFFD